MQQSSEEKDAQIRPHGTWVPAASLLPRTSHRTFEGVALSVSLPHPVVIKSPSPQTIAGKEREQLSFKENHSAHENSSILNEQVKSMDKTAHECEQNEKKHRSNSADVQHHCLSKRADPSTCPVGLSWELTVNQQKVHRTASGSRSPSPDQENSGSTGGHFAK